MSLNKFNLVAVQELTRSAVFYNVNWFGQFFEFQLHQLSLQTFPKLDSRGQETIGESAENYFSKNEQGLKYLILL